MKSIAAYLLVLMALPIGAHAGEAAGERLGTVSFSTSCSPEVQVSFNRGVALLHDFWYEEARHQFEQISKSDPSCAMAHWGAAMSEFHQIWSRPNEGAMARGWSEMQKAQSPPAKTAREREFIAALSGFYQPGKRDYRVRVTEYSAAMAKLYSRYADDVDAGTF
jgi:hypothetical protein